MKQTRRLLSIVVLCNLVWYAARTFEKRANLMQTGKTIWYFIKFCAKQEHAEMFMDGKLFMNRLSYFKPLDTASGDGRGDQSEAVSHWWQPHDTTIKLTFPGFPELTLTKDDLAFPTSMSYEFHDHLHIFCMYGMATAGFDMVDGKIEYSPDQADELKRQLAIDERCFEFGEFAVVVPATQLVERVKASLTEKRLPARLRAVDYFDGTIFHGEVKVEEIPFRKLRQYSYQNEFRICINTGTRGEDPMTLDIGSLRDCSAMARSSDLNKLFSIESIAV